MSERIVNLLELALESSEDAPGDHRFAGSSLTRDMGAVATGMSVYEIEPGFSSWPYHFELAAEEWLIVISGEVVLRTPEGERTLRAGDVACFPAGAAGAHAVRNASDANARFAMPSTRGRYGGATVYPDSGKFVLRGPGFSHRGYLGEAVTYWEGEP